MNMGWGYYAIILVLIVGCVGFLYFQKKRAAASSPGGQKPPQRGIIK